MADSLWRIAKRARRHRLWAMSGARAPVEAYGAGGSRPSAEHLTNRIGRKRINQTKRTRRRQARSPHDKPSDRRRTGDAWASRADEGRGTLRKVSGSRVQAKNRQCPNGETRLWEPQSPLAEHIGQREGTRGTETSQYPEEKRRFRE
jgi:hypothetical protein